jgi:hypothetical protein
MRSLFGTWGASTVFIVSTIFRSCSMWLCKEIKLTYCRQLSTVTYIASFAVEAGR